MTLRLRVTLPTGTPAAWTPSGETLHVALRRAGRVEPILDTSFVVGDSLAATFTVPLAYKVERFVVVGEARYGGLLLFLGFDVVQLRAAGDTTITMVATYVGPGSRAASYALGARDSTLGQGDTASLVPVVRDSAGFVIPNVPARYVAARPTFITVDPSGTLTAQPAAPDTARVTGYLPMGFSSSLLVSLVQRVESVTVSPSAVTVALGGSPAFTATAFDAVGVFPGQTFVWASSDTLVARINQTGVATTVGTGVATIRATTAGVTGSATLTVTTPVGAVKRTWLGNTALWSSAANWDPAGAPGVADTAEIVGSPADPILDVNATVAAVLIRGGNLTLNGRRLVVNGLFTTVGESGLGTFTMNQPGDTLRVLGDAVFEGGPTAGLLTDGVLFVAGAFEQRNDASEGGSFLANGNHRTVLNGGGQQRFHIEGNATFGHLDVANTGGVVGELAQTVDVEGKLRLLTPVVFDGVGTYLDIEDSLVTVAGSHLTSAHVRLHGGMAVAGTFDPAIAEFAGDSQAIQTGLGYRDVWVTDQVRLVGATAVAGTLLITEGGNLNVNGHSLSVLHLNVATAGANRGALTMQHPADRLIVSGDATFDGDTLPGLLTDGLLRIAGNLTIGSGSASRGVLRASGNHRTVLDGAGRQVLRLAASATFHHLDIANGGGVDVPQVGGDVRLDIANGGSVEVSQVDGSDVFTVGGKLRVTTPVAFDGFDDEPRHVGIDVGDSLVTVAGSALNLDGLVLRGPFALGGGLLANTVEFAGVDQEIPLLAYDNITVSGTARLTGRTSLERSAVIRGPQANLALNGHTLAVGQSFTIGGVGIPEGRLTMTNPADSLIVSDAAVFYGAPSTGLLTAGTLLVAGGFHGGDDPAAFQPSGTHRTVLNGAAQQIIEFTQPGAALSRFNDLELANTAGGLWLRSDVYVAGQLRKSAAAPLTIAGPSHHRLTAAGVDAARLTFDSVSFAIGGGAITRFDSVTFQRQNRTATQLAITHPGAAAPFTFTGTRFLSPPSTGLFVSATDAAPSDGAVLTIDLAGSTPADGSARTVTAGGAVVGWSAGPPPPPGSFVATGSMVDARYSHASVLLFDGSVLAVGGLATRAERYDTASGSFATTTGSISRFREGLTATTLYDGRVLITGGGQVFPATTRTAELYDPATQAFALTDSLGDSIPAQARGRRYHTATLLADGRVIVVGGEGVASSVLYRLRSAESYSDISETFTVLTSPARARSRHVAALLPGGRVLVAGGQTNFVDTGDNHAEIYDPVTNTWSPTGVMTWWRNGHTATVLADGRVLITGGSELRQDANRRVRKSEIYDPATGTFTATDSMAFKRQWHTATLLADGRVLIAGGLDENNQPVSTAELYDPIAGTFSPTGITVNLRDRHAAIRLPDGRVLVTGGFNGGSAAELYIP